LIDAAIARLRGMNMLTQLSFYLGLRARALLTLNRQATALECVDEALATALSNDEHYFEPELHRMKGEMLLHADYRRADAAQTCFLEAVRASRYCEAKSLELRAAMSLAQLWQTQGKKKEGFDFLAPVYTWFTEGFDTKDLKQAKALLEELSA
jgi:predicted ATPase